MKYKVQVKQKANEYKTVANNNTLIGCVSDTISHCREGDTYRIVKVLENGIETVVVDDTIFNK